MIYQPWRFDIHRGQQLVLQLIFISSPAKVMFPYYMYLKHFMRNGDQEYPEMLLWEDDV